MIVYTDAFDRCINFIIAPLWLQNGERANECVAEKLLKASNAGLVSNHCENANEYLA